MAVQQELAVDLSSLNCAYPVRRAQPDPVLLDRRVLDNLLTAETRYLPSPNYFQCVQTDIEPWMRETVAKWMLEVCEEQHREEDVFPLAMNYLDRFLSIVNIHRTQLQALAATCMFIASKLRETLPISSETLVIYTDNSITVEDVRGWETMLLNRLKWDISAVTPNDFLDQLICRLPQYSPEQKKTVRRHAQIFVSLCIASDIRFSMYPASILASACVSTAVNGFIETDSCARLAVLYDLQKIALMDIDYLIQVQQQVDKLLSVNHVTDPSTPESGEQWMPSTPEAGSKIPSQPTTPTDVREVLLT